MATKKAKRRTKTSKPTTRPTSKPTTRWEVTDIPAKHAPFMFSVKLDQPHVGDSAVAEAFEKVMAILEGFNSREAKVRVLKAAAILLGIEVNEQKSATYTTGP